MKILIIEDDQDIADLLIYNLTQERWTVQHQNRGGGFETALDEFKPDLVILDLMLPDCSGMDICRDIKSRETYRNISVLMLTAKSEEVDRIVGFELGADDYVVKPFSPRELILRIKSVLRRNLETKETASKSPLKFGSLQIFPDKFQVKVSNQSIPLTSLEFKILSFLIRMPGKVATREVLLDKVWGYSAEMTTRTVDTHIKRLREKLNEAGDYIETVRGIGYRFKELIE